MSMRTVEPVGYADQRDEFQNPQSQAAESISIIDRFSNFDGTFESTRDLRIEGQAKGNITCQGTLHVAQGANVNARVDAENITVAGELEGEISCKGRLQILPSGRVRGKIDTATLVINEGAFYEGQLEMTGGTSLSSSRPTRGRPSPPSSGNPVPIGGESARTSIETPAPGNTFIRRLGGQEQNWDGDQRSADSTDSPVDEGN
ncbi:MAG: polymer-forming cytoskeletal protein [Thermomicrobiales bacterium]